MLYTLSMMKAHIKKTMPNCTCQKCGMKDALQETGIYPLCYICFLKSKGFYSFAIKTLKNLQWWSYKTHWDFEPGWTFTGKMLTGLLLGAVVNCGSLNKNPKLPELMCLSKKQKLEIIGWSSWQIQTFFQKYPEYINN